MFYIDVTMSLGQSITRAFFRYLTASECPSSVQFDDSVSPTTCVNYSHNEPVAHSSFNESIQ